MKGNCHQQLPRKVATDVQLFRHSHYQFPFVPSPSDIINKISLFIMNSSSCKGQGKNVELMAPTYILQISSIFDISAVIDSSN